jgi:hypothetical protein
MAANSTRVKQRGQAVNRLIAAADAAARATGVEAIEIPTHHREPDYLMTLQIEAAADLLERIAAGAPEPAAQPSDDQDATATDTDTTAAATDTPRRATSARKPSKGR